MIPVIVVGAGGFGRESLDVLEAMNRTSGGPIYDILGVVDDGPDEEDVARLAVREFSVVGGVEDWLLAGHRAQFIIGIGDTAVRRRIDERFREFGRTAATAIHPGAVVGSHPSLGEGTVLCAGVQVSTNVRLGRHVHVNPSATIGHDVVLEDFVSINPAAVISGNVLVDEGALIGAGAVVLQGLTVGAGATVGAAACVVDDAPAGSTVKGIPAR
jgi:sugar O-acyltransferase (sialic acid O-acetyltransferase NeuD family)